MATLATLVVKLGLDAREYQTGLDAAANKMKSAGDSMVSVGQKLTLGVTAPIIAAGGAALKLAIDAEETASKFNTVLGPATDAMNAKITEMQRTIPMTRQELQGSIADITMLGKATGLTAEGAADLSVQFVTAAADLGSFNNVPTAEALASIRSGLVGASEPLLKFGIDTRQATLEALALKHGMIEQGEAMDAATRAQAVLLAIQTHAADAMGDAARTADSTANSMKFLKRDVLDLATEIGQQLIPIIQPVIAQLKEWLAKLKEMDPGTRNVILVVAGLAAALGPVLVVVGTLVGAIGALIPVVTAIGAALGGVTLAAAAPVVAIGALIAALVLLYQRSETFRDIVNAAFQKVKEVAVSVFESLRDFFGEIAGELYETIEVRFIEPFNVIWNEWGDEITTVAKLVWETLSTIIGTQLKIIGEIISVAFNTIKEGILLVLNLIQGDWSGAWENIKSIVSGVGDAILGIVGALWDGIKGLFAESTENVRAAVAELFERIAQTFASIKQTAITIVQAMWEEIKAVFANAIGAVRDKMQEVQETVVGAFQRIKDLVVSNSIWTDMWDEIQGVTSAATGLIDGLLNDWKGTLLGIFDDLSGGLIGKMQGLWGTIQGIFSGGISGIINGLSSLVPQVTSIVNTVTGLIGQVTGAVGTATAAVAGAATTIGTAATGITIGTGGVVGVSGTAGGLSTGAGIPTIGTGAAGGTLATVAGAALPFAITAAIPTVMDAITGLFGWESAQENFNEMMASAAEIQAAAATWFEETGYQPGFATGDYSVPTGLTQEQLYYAATPGYQNIKVTIPVNLDGQQITEVVAPIMVNMLA